MSLRGVNNVFLGCKLTNLHGINTHFFNMRTYKIIYLKMMSISTLIQVNRFHINEFSYKVLIYVYAISLAISNS